MKTGKNFKCWGVSYGVVGDLVMAIPILTYLEKKHPGSYKYWIIEKKVAFTAPLYLNHPLIDCIRITGEWGGFSKEDYDIANTCDFKCTMDNWKHDELDWYNYRGQVEETARIAGIYDLKEVLTVEEMYPKLTPWWGKGEKKDKAIAIWPFAGRDAVALRSPSVKWWKELINKICYDLGCHTALFGLPNDPYISGVYDFLYEDYRELSYFEQVQKALQCKMSIGTDSGNMWVMGAYGHPAIHLMTNWLPGHTKNFSALTPVNNNSSVTFLGEGGINNISQEDVLSVIERMMSN